MEQVVVGVELEYAALWKQRGRGGDRFETALAQRPKGGARYGALDRRVCGCQDIERKPVDVARGHPAEGKRVGQRDFVRSRALTMALRSEERRGHMPAQVRAFG
jgi:hypothetical protein